MTTYTWSGTGTTSWNMAADWLSGASSPGTMLPTDLDTANITGAGIDVQVGTLVSAAAYVLNTTGATLSITGGTLTTEHLATFNGKVAVTTGSYIAGGMGAVFNQNLTEAAGATIDVVTGVLNVNGGSTLSGIVSGTGVLDFGGNGTNNYIEAGFKSNISAIEVTGGAKLGLGENLIFGHNLTVNGSTLDLFGHTLTASGILGLSGLVGDGTIQDTGNLTLGTNNQFNGTETLDNGLILNVFGTANQVNNVALGAADSGAKVVIVKTGQYDINGNWTISDPSSVGSIANAGILAKTGGGKLAQINTQVTSTGTIEANIGELQLDGLVNSIAGTVSGAGTFGIGTVNGSVYGQTVFAPKLLLSVANFHQASGNLVINAAQAYAGNWNMSGGVLNLNAAAAVLTLSTGHSNFDFGTITGYGGSLVLNGPSQIGTVTIGGPNIIDVNGTLTQTGLVQLGQSSSPTVKIAAAASWRIDADSSIFGQYGVIDNAGVLWDRNGSSTSTIQSQIFNTGTIIADSTLQLASLGSDLHGTLSGIGLIDLANSNGSLGTTTLDTGLSIQVAALDISSYVDLAASQADAKIFTQYTGTLDLSGHTFALSGISSLDGGTLTDAGTLTTSGQTTVGNYTVTGGADLLVSGAADQTGGLTLADGSGSGTLTVATTGVYNVLDNPNAISGAGVVLISGHLTESGTGTSQISAAVTLASSGVLTANDRTLLLTNGASLAGTLAGTGAVALASGSFTLAGGLVLDSATLEIGNGASALLLGNATTAGDFRLGDFQTNNGGTLNLGVSTFTVSGPALLGNGSTLSGAGTLMAEGATTLLGPNVLGSTVLTIAGTASQLGTMSVGVLGGPPSTATLAITGTETLDAYASITGDGTLSVAASGSLVAGGNGLSQIITAIVDQGTIAANLGDLQIIGNVSAGSTGLFSIGGAAELDFTSSSTVGSATGISFAAGGNGTLRIDDLKTFGATIGAFSVHDMIQINGIVGAATGTYANNAHTQILVSDSSGDSIVLAFATAQTLNAITISDTSNVATLTHT